MDKQRFKASLLLIAFGVLLFTLAQNFALAWRAFWKIYSIFSPVVTGFCIAFVLNVLLRVLERRVFAFLGRSRHDAVRRLLRPVSLAATIVLMLGAVVLLVWVVLPGLQKTILSLVQNLELYLDSAQNLMHTIDRNGRQLFNIQLDWERIFDKLKEVLTPDDNLVETAAGVTTSVIRSVTNLVISFCLSIYILARKERVGQLATRLSDAIFPPKVSRKIRHICKVANNSFSNFITGQLTEAAILGFLCFLGMKIFQFPNATIISILIAVTALVPVIGPIIGEVIGCLLILIESPIQALLFLVFVLTLQLIEGNVIYPKVVGRSVGLPGLIVLMAVIIGGNMGGMMGVLLGVPISSVLYTLVLDWLDGQQPTKEETET